VTAKAHPPDYARVLAALLPEEAFQRNPGRIVYAGLQLALYAALVSLVRTAPSWALLPICVLAGHTLFCLALFAHELSHGAILRPNAPRFLLEFVTWGLNFIAPTVWSVVHNQTHHRHVNTDADPDRRFMRAEKNVATTIYTSLFYPHREAPTRWNPLILIHFIPYVLRNTFALLSGGSPTTLVPGRLALLRGQRQRISAELLGIAALQIGLHRAAGGHLCYVAVGPGAALVASMFVMAYVFTNHFGDDLKTAGDVLGTTTSVIVPRLIDRLHLHFSFHTEHHLFPSLDSRQYRAISQLLGMHYPERYKRLGFVHAWSRVWAQSGFPQQPVPPLDSEAPPDPCGLTGNVLSETRGTLGTTRVA
jgi:fatty acid desaturase